MKTITMYEFQLKYSDLEFTYQGINYRVFDWYKNDALRFKSGHLLKPQQTGGGIIPAPEQKRTVLKMKFKKGDLIKTAAGLIEIYDAWNKRRGGKLIELYKVTYLEYDITETVTAGRLARIMEGEL